ncbi:tRNA pseudouridine(55) synthase TruB [Compostimonas suwonensis]|uniref:tRNA pseudouridine synthase B n=1 Tax=Compostimonas suwonensis TaxID=1048394 RepID=A0A2M9BU92_9MICO|nr:tRNA pseudouridine(55) synthase TruB [Compostimonas suwonensis]PJJ61515.1 tRNA pseudouridine55 synthase [Compostimonas suwonensis]
MRRPQSTRSGLLLVDKPAEWTSHDVVARTRRLAQTRKVGHAGTLDPMATGLLILGVNSSTRLLTYIVGLDKEYTATIRLGAASTTDDADGELLDAAEPTLLAAVTPERIRAGLALLTGEIDQVPSAVSAIKVDGKRAYARVRAGEDVQLDARRVTIAEFELLETRRPAVSNADPAEPAWIDLDVRVVCSSGTYVRALARDLGAGLGVGGHLTALRRTRIGPFGIAEAEALDELEPERSLVAPAVAASALFATLALSEEEAVDLGHGKRIAVDPGFERGVPIAALAPNGRLVGLVEARGGQAVTLVNFPADETQPHETQPDETQEA